MGGKRREGERRGEERRGRERRGEDRRGEERMGGRERTRDWVWQRCEHTGHAQIGKGHDSTCRLSPAGSTLCTAMLFWLGSLHPPPPPHPVTPHRHTLPANQPHKIQLGSSSPSHRGTRSNSRGDRPTASSSRPKCHGFGESAGARAQGPGLMETPNSLL